MQKLKTKDINQDKKILVFSEKDSQNSYVYVYFLLTLDSDELFNFCLLILSVEVQNTSESGQMYGGRYNIVFFKKVLSFNEHIINCLFLKNTI